MPQQIAILGWGSLLWEGGSDFDRWHDDWRYDGPSLKIEFSRVSSSRLGALTLVVDLQDGSATTVAWCLSRRNSPDDAVADLRCREGCSVRHIARLDVSKSSDKVEQPDGSTDIRSWAQGRELDVIIWTALPSNFECKVKTPFSVRDALVYLKMLSPQAKVKAAEYLWRAPEFVRTPLRTAIEKEPWFRDDGS